MPVAPEKYHCLGLWIDLLGTEDRFAYADFETVGRELTTFYHLCQTHLATVISPAAPGGRRRLDFGDTVYEELATTGSRCVSLLPAIKTIVRAVGQNVQVLITEGNVYRPTTTEGPVTRWERKYSRNNPRIDAQRREERERMVVGYSEPLKAAWRAEPTIKDPEKRRSSIGIQSTAIPYLADEIGGEHVLVNGLTFQLELIPG